MRIKDPAIREVLLDWGLRCNEDGSVMSYTKSPLHPAKIKYINPAGTLEAELPADWGSLVHYLSLGWRIHPTVIPPFCSDKAKLARLQAQVAADIARGKAEEVAIRSGTYKCRVCNDLFPNEGQLADHIKQHSPKRSAPDRKTSSTGREGA